MDISSTKTSGDGTSTNPGPDEETTTGGESTVFFGFISDNLIAILIDTPYDIAGFQFDVVGASISGGSGGLAADAGFTVSAGGETVLGFSFTGNVIPAGSSGILTNLIYSSSTASEFCIDDLVLAGSNGDAITDYKLGDCVEY